MRRLLLGSTLALAWAANLRAESPPVASRGRAIAYIDERHLTALPFGAHSYWLQPWRAYQETVPATRFLEAQGIGLTLPQGESPELIARMLADHGITRGRIEIGWASLHFDDETRLNDQERLKSLLLACKSHRIRPLILLNAHSGVPGPIEASERVLAREAKKGDRRLELVNAEGLKADFSGLANLTEYWASEVLITRIDGREVELSRPLPRDLGGPGAKVLVTTLKYRPFSAPGTDDYRRTIAGWTAYVRTIARFVAETLGTRANADRGFDMEIWNELTFGSRFLSINNYYEPKPFRYDETAIWTDLVRETADFAARHPDDFLGVTLVDGFRNTIPWPASSREPARIGAMSSHPYFPRKVYPADEPEGPLVNAAFVEEPRGFRPAFTAMFPEYYATALQTESVVRDMAPINTPIYGVQHGRDARVIAGKIAPCPLWFTEKGMHAREFGLNDRRAALRVKAKMVARTACFFAGKGVERIYFFTAVGGDLEFGLILDDFVEYAKAHRTYPADDARYVSPALLTLGRIAARMRAGLDPKLAETRPITVASVADAHDHVQFRGDGRPEHPNLWNRDVLAILPFQVNRKRFVIPYYVMTYDVTKELAPEEYTVRIRGIDGRGASVDAYDPMADVQVPSKIESGDADGLTVILQATDYPYLLTIQEGGEPTR